MLTMGIIQTVSSVVLSLAGIMLAFLVYRIQKDRNTPKVVLVCDELAEDELGEACPAVKILNVGLVPATSVELLVDIEEWQNGKEVRSKFHERYSAFQSTTPLLESMDSRQYRLPTPEDRSYIFTVMVTCRGGTGDQARFLIQGSSSDVASDRIALGHVRADWSTAIQRLKSGRPTGILGVARFGMGAEFLKDYNRLFGTDET